MNKETPTILAIHRAICEDNINECLEDYGNCVKAAQAIQPSIITTVDELRALDVESIIRDVDGLPKEKQNDGEGCTFWAAPGHEEQYTEADIYLPAVVLYNPSDGAQ